MLLLITIFCILSAGKYFSWFDPFNQADSVSPFCNSSHPNFVNVALTFLWKLDILFIFLFCTLET